MGVGFIFPGQGSQAIGMLSELAEHYPLVIETFAQASDVLNYDLWQLVQAGPETDLNDTRHTQPAMLAAGVAVWRVWQARHGAEPTAMAGHSLGEYTALVCAQALDFKSAVALVAKRGQSMQAAVPAGDGAMAAILGLDDNAVRDACGEAAQGDVVEAVNFNAPGQVVIAGQIAAVMRAIEAAKIAGAKRAVLLPVSVPSHCALMKPAAESLAAVLAQVEIAPPIFPVINNCDAIAYTDASSIRDGLTRQLYSPVRWVDSVNALAQKNIRFFVEAGPGKVLTGLGKRIASDLPVYPVFDTSSLTTALEIK